MAEMDIENGGATGIAADVSRAVANGCSLSRALDLLSRCLDEMECLKDSVRAVKGEVASVLILMDGLAETWGDEGVFRRCRDRLRDLVV